MKNWVDFSRRNDPAHKEGLNYLRKNIKKKGSPEVFNFWTKAPELVYEIYEDAIKYMQDQGTLVLLQTTINNYKEMESVPSEKQKLGNIIDLLGGPEYVRVRFDPIIIGYTKPKHLKKTIDVVKKHGIDRITTNFLVPEYKGVGKLLTSEGFDIEQNPTDERKIGILKGLRRMIPGHIDLAMCAESEYLRSKTNLDLKKASCSDPEWATSIRPELKGVFSVNSSRRGCGCVYDDDWLDYASRGGYKCPFQCMYCYAK